jgi:anti-sigma B factor antagonist
VVSPRAEDANIRIDRSGSQHTVAVTGRVTIDSSPRLRSVLLGLITKRAGVVVDMSGVTRMDTSGLATLLEALNTAHEHSVRLRVTGVSGQPRKLAELVELEQIFRASGSEVEFR